MATATAVKDATGSAGDGASRARKWNGVYIQTPADVRARLVEEAEAAGTTPALFVRKLLHERYGIAEVPGRTRAKYNSPEEAKAAQTARRHARASIVEDALKAYLAEHPELAAQFRVAVGQNGDV